MNDPEVREALPWDTLEWGRHTKRAKMHAWIREDDSRWRYAACGNVEPSSRDPEQRPHH